MNTLKRRLIMPQTNESTNWLMEQLTWIFTILGSTFAFLFFGFKFKMAELQAKTEKEIRQEEITAKKEREYVFNLVKETTKASIEAILTPNLEDIRHNIKQVNDNLERNSAEHREEIKELRTYILKQINLK